LQTGMFGKVLPSVALRPGKWLARHPRSVHGGDKEPHSRPADATRPVTARIPGLDLVRAVAILLVLVCHCANVFCNFWNKKPPDFVALSGVFGVELFFVLSGFLIGGLLASSATACPGWRGWWVFMLRRWMRTLPLYFTAIAIMAVVWPPADGRLAWHLLHYASLTQNLAWKMPADNWFGVSWSLTIEEWFYLLFSLPLLLAARWDKGRKSLPALVMVFIVVPNLVRFAAPPELDFGQVLYRAVAFRLDAIAYGVGASLIVTRYPGLLRRGGVWLATGLMIVAFVWVQIDGLGVALPSWFYRFLFLPLLAFGFCCCLPAALRLPQRSRWSAPCVFWLSTRSYGLYIVHLTVLEMATAAVFYHGFSRPGAIVSALAASAMLAELSWRLIEQPVLRRRPVQASVR